MIGRTNAGGGGGTGKAYAAISVTYPIGSVCTCSNGSKTLKAKDTSGSFLFLVPSGGEWTVSCTDGTDTAYAIADVVEHTACAIELYYVSMEELRTMMDATNYAALSTNSGDSMTMRGRSAVRTGSEPPLLFCITRHANAEFSGYAAVSLTQNFGAYSATQYGDLITITEHQTPAGTTFYTAVMYGQWGGENTIDVVVNNVKKSWNTASAMCRYNDVTLEFYGSAADEMYHFIDYLKRVVG